MVLIGLLYESFLVNLSKLPNHIIQVRKQDVINIQTIRFRHHFKRVNLNGCSTIDLSKLEDLYIFGKRPRKKQKQLVEININGLSSLVTMNIDVPSTRKSFSITNLNSLTNIELCDRTNIINQNVIENFERLPNLKSLTLEGNLSYFNLDNLVNLKYLSLSGIIKHKFNLEIFKNLCNQLTGLTIGFTNIDDHTLFEMFDGHHFSNLRNLIFRQCYIKRVDESFIDRFSMIKNLSIFGSELEVIEPDAFSNAKQLDYLNLSGNMISSIPKNAFSNLKNLETLILINNELESLEREYIGVGNSVKISRL